MKPGIANPAEPTVLDARKIDVAPKVTKDKNQGVRVNQWFYAALEPLAPKPQGARREAEPAGTRPGAPTPAGDATDEVNQELVKNPAMSAATFFNLLKSKGIRFIREAVSGSAHVAALRARDKKKLAAQSKTKTLQMARLYRGKESDAVAEVAATTMRFTTRFVESSARDNGIGPTRFRVILLQEGLGNLRDAYFYSRAALESAIPVFEGKKIYADHPTAQEEEIRPERSVKDVLGHFENVAVQEGEGGVAQLVGEVVVLPDKPYEWARALMRHSVEYAKKFPDKDFVGLSINASGDAEEVKLADVLESAPLGAQKKLQDAAVDGVETVRVVTVIKEAISCDLVTEAGAGGKILEMLEREIEMKNQKVKEAEGSEALPPKKDAEAPAKDECNTKNQKPAEEAAADSTDGQHDDAAQDAELIKKMLDEYLGKDGYSSEDVEACSEAAKCAMEAGESKETALQMAGHAMKMAKILQMKHSEKKESSEAEEAEESEESEGAHEAKAVESLRAKLAAKEEEIVKLRGALAGFQESAKKAELARHLDETLRASGLPMAVTKAFRESLGEPKTKEEIDAKFKLFQEGHKAARGGEAAALGGDFWLTPEKVTTDFGKSDAVGFADCVK